MLLLPGIALFGHSQMEECARTEVEAKELAHRILGPINALVVRGSLMVVPIPGEDLIIGKVGVGGKGVNQVGIIRHPLCQDLSDRLNHAQSPVAGQILKEQGRFDRAVASDTVSLQKATAALRVIQDTADACTQPLVIWQAGAVTPVLGSLKGFLEWGEEGGIQRSLPGFIYYTHAASNRLLGLCVQAENYLPFAAQIGECLASAGT